MKKLIPLLLAILAVQNSLFAQDHCNNPEDNLGLDTSNITKCSIQDWKDDKGNTLSGRNQQISIEISPRRYFKKLRKVRKSTSSIETNMNDLSDLSVKEPNSTIVGVNTVSTNETAFNFKIVEKAASFKECNGKSSDCFLNRLSKHIKKRFYYPKEALRQGIEGKVLVEFIVNKNGIVDLSKIKTRGPKNGHTLVAEAKRIISDLPQFTPGTHNNIPVNVKYIVPISFKLPEGATKAKKSEEMILTNVISFANVEEVPLFSSCKSTDKEKQSGCFNIQMMKHIQKNFTYPKYAVENNIEGKVWVKFVIDKKGKVRNIKLRSGAPILQSEAERLIAKLPKFKPGKQNGKPANVSYVLPVNFRLGR